MVSTHDRARLIPELVAALEAQTLAPTAFEVVIVDDGSTDATWAVLQAVVAGTPLRMLAAHGTSNRGAASSRNAAVSFTRSPTLVFTDDDCLPTPTWLGALQRALDSGADVVQGRTLPYEPGRPAAGHWSRSVWVPRPSGLFEACNIAYRRTAFDRAGGFPAGDPVVDRRDGRPFGEDALLGSRALSAGASFAFAADALVRHRYEPAGYVDWLREQRRASRFAALARRCPAFRDQLLGDVFLSRVTAAVDVAMLASLATAVSRRWWPLLGVVPWLVLRHGEARHRAAGRPPVARYPQLALGDAVTLVALIEGSVRHRRLVL